MFRRNPFNPTSFSAKSFAGATEEQSARSGYWRLFFYQLQEQALEKKSTVQKQATGGIIKVKPPVVKKPVVRRIREEFQDETVNFPKLLTQPTKPAEEDSFFIADIWRITLEVRNWVDKYVLMCQQPQVIPEDADEGDIELLLLMV